MAMNPLHDPLEHRIELGDLIGVPELGQFAPDDRDDHLARQIDMVERVQHLIHCWKLPPPVRLYFVMHTSGLRDGTILPITTASGVEDRSIRRSALGRLRSVMQRRRPPLVWAS